MKFSEYVMNESLDGGIKDTIKDTAIKVGRKLGVKKAKDTQTSGEKAEIEKVKKEQEKIRLENAHDSVVKATKILKKFIQDGLSKFSTSNSALVGSHFAEVEKLSFGLNCRIPSGMRSNNNEKFYKWKGELYKKCKTMGVYIYDEWRNGDSFFMAFKVPSNPKLIKD